MEIVKFSQVKIITSGFHKPFIYRNKASIMSYKYIRGIELMAQNCSVGFNLHNLEVIV